MIDRRGFVAGLGAGVAAAGAGSALAASGNDADLAGRLDRYFAPFVAARDFSAIVVIDSAGQQLVRTWGRADFASGRPHTLHTRYAAESISKMFTHAAVLALQAAGKLTMSDPLARYVPTFPRAAEITLRQLVDHTAGISRDLAFDDAEAARPHGTAELVVRIARTVNAAPGERAYSNNGYRILARVIEVAGGGGFDGLVRELVFEPRRMGETVFGGNSAQPMARRATGYVPGPGWRTLRKDAPWDFANSRGAASWFTTASDLLRFLATLPLEPGGIHDAPGATADGPFRRVAGHDGFGSGFANLAYLYPDAKTRLVLLGNIQSGLFMSLEKDVRALLAGQAVTGPVIERPPALPPSDRWRDYAGAYDLRPGAPMVIRRAGDHLEVSGGEAFYPLVATAPNAFFMRLRYARLTFPSAGPVDRVDWDEGGSRYSLKKLA